MKSNNKRLVLPGVLLLYALIIYYYYYGMTVAPLNPSFFLPAYLLLIVPVSLVTGFFGAFPGLLTSCASFTIYILFNAKNTSDIFSGMVVFLGFGIILYSILKNKEIRMKALYAEKQNLLIKNENLDNRFFQESNRHNMLLILLSDMANRMGQSLDTASLFNIITDFLKDVLHVRKCAVFIHDNAEDRYIPVITIGYDDKSIDWTVRRGTGLTGYSVKNKTIVTADEAENSGDIRAAAAEDPEPVRIAVPVIFEDKVICLIAINDILEINEDTTRILFIFSNLISISFQNTRIFEAVEKLSLEDPLTKLSNNRYLLSNFRENMGRHGTISLIMLDIDNFKKVNDLHGHLAGDRVLVKVAEAMRGSIRKEEAVVARYGGEEFAVLLYGVPLKLAAEVAERIRKSAEDMTFSGAIEGLKVTVSLGVMEQKKPAECGAQPEDCLKLMIKKADELLYEAKRSGKNVVKYDPDML